MLFSRFFKDRRASVAPLLALSALPIMGAVGAAVDYSRANSIKASMQAALDSTALMLAKDAQSLNPTQLSQKAHNDFTALFTRPEAQNVQITALYNQAASGSTVAVNGSATISTNFMGVMGFSQLPISASASVTWGMSRLRVALALDNTGSMASAGKMTALKAAAHNLLDQMKTAAQNPGDVYVSIIPFSRDVNVGASNYAASWIDWTDWDQANGTCSKSTYTTYSSCTSNGKTWTHKNHNTWNGCVTDRDQNFDALNTAPTSGSTLFPAEQYSSCPVSLMALSYDWTALNNKIDAMQPSGNTNQAIGLAWGWQSLTAAPLTVPPKDPNYQYQDIIILLTDGLNTQDRWYSNASAIDNREQIACNNIKAGGITIYTVQVNTDGDPTSNLLKNCASDPSKFFLLTSSNQIVTTFNTIGTTLAKLHLSK